MRLCEAGPVLADSSSGPYRRVRINEGIGRCASSELCRRSSILKVFADYVLTLGMKTRIDDRPEGRIVWIYNEDHLERAREELNGYLAARPAIRVLSRAAVDSAKTIRKKEQRLDQKYRKNFREAADLWGHPSVNRRPVTVALIVVCVGVFFLNQTNLNSRLAATSTDVHDDDRRPRKAETQQRDPRHRARRDLAARDAHLPPFRHHPHPCSI